MAYYVATELGPEVTKKFISHAVNRLCIKSIIQTPQGVEVERRKGIDGYYIFLLNHTPKAAVLNIPLEWTVRIGEKFMRGNELHLSQYAVAVFKSEQI